MAVIGRPSGRGEAASRDSLQTSAPFPNIDPGSPLRVVWDDGALMNSDNDDAGLPIWRDGRFQADEWTLAGEDDAVAEGPALLTLSRFLAERDALTARNAPLGVVVEPGEAIEELVPHLGRVTLVALSFPRYADGRNLSSARLLRERYGYAGEIRAVGDVLIDQMPLMRRCGIDSFKVTNGPTRAQLAAGKWPDVPFYYQPVGSSTQPEVPSGTRPWARRPG